MPNLRSGTGMTPKDGGCLVQVAGWLNDGHSWTDATPCVLPLLRSVAIRLNDSLDDAQRAGIIRFAPALIGTGHPDNPGYEKAITAHLAEWCVTYARQKANSVAHLCAAAAYTAADAHAAAADQPLAYTAAADAYTAAAAYARIQFMQDILDEYDRFTGRQIGGKTVTEEQWRALVDAMTAA